MASLAEHIRLVKETCNKLIDDRNKAKASI
jgi:hypothetical protein